MAFRSPFNLGRTMSVGLLGGSFDPPHQGHVHLSQEALKRFGLDRLIWLVSPGNPLKPNPPAPLHRRIKAATSLLSDPRILVSDYESQSGTRYTAETLQSLRLRHSEVKFVWLMGADNLVQIHRWENWHSIFETTPVGILARPGMRIPARTSTAARLYADCRLAANASRLLPHCDAPVWCFTNISMRDDSSTAIRASGKW